MVGHLCVTFMKSQFYGLRFKRNQDIMEAAGSSETFIDFYWNTWHLIPEDSSLHMKTFTVCRSTVRRNVFAGSQILSIVTASFLSLSS